MKNVPATRVKFSAVFAPEEISPGSCGRDVLTERGGNAGAVSASHGLESVGSVLKRIKPELLISKQKLRQVDGSCRVRLSRGEGKQNVGFSSRPFVLCGLPVRKPPQVNMLDEHRNGNLNAFLSSNPGSPKNLPKPSKCAFYLRTRTKRKLYCCWMRDIWKRFNGSPGLA